MQGKPLAAGELPDDGVYSTLSFDKLRMTG